MNLFDRRTEIAEVLKAHQPTTNTEKRVYVCACGLEFHFIDAKAWHRHAAMMVVNALKND